MTPFARMILRDYADNNVGIPYDNDGGTSNKKHLKTLINGIVNAKCFDCSDVKELSATLVKKMSVLHEINGKMEFCLGPTDTSFLPSEKMWIESEISKGSWWGVMLICPDGIGTAYGLCVLKNEYCTSTIIGEIYLHLNNGHPIINFPNVVEPFGNLKEVKSILYTFAGYIYPLLAIINSPSVIGRQEFPAHKGFEKSLRHSNVIPPGAHLRPWTKITLDVTPPSGEHGEHGGARLTGAKALHYCRTHIRIKNGKLERVRGHWRGDAALGVVRSDYKVKA